MLLVARYAGAEVIEKLFSVAHSFERSALLVRVRMVSSVAEVEALKVLSVFVCPRAADNLYACPRLRPEASDAMLCASLLQPLLEEVVAVELDA